MVIGVLVLLTGFCGRRVSGGIESKGKARFENEENLLSLVIWVPIAAGLLTLATAPSAGPSIVRAGGSTRR